MSCKEKNILIIMTDKHMGNFVVSIPAIRAIISHCGKDNVYLLIDAAYKEIAETIIGYEHLMFFPRNALKGMPALKRLRNYLNLIKGLRRIGPQIAVDLEGRQASATFSILSGAGKRLGRTGAERPYLYNQKIRVSPDRHRVWGYIEIAEHLGFKVSEPDYKITATDEKRLLLKQKLNSLGIREDGLVCIHPGAGKIYKQWPVERFSKLADFIVDMGYNVIFIGSSKDMVNTQKIQSLMKNSSYNLVNRLTLGELIALFEQTLLYIGNDSGPLHLASQTGTPVIGLFGSADENRWGPLGKNSIVLRGAERCQKCKGKDCKYDFRCIRQLKTETVMAAVQSIIHKDMKKVGKDVS